MAPRRSIAAGILIIIAATSGSAWPAPADATHTIETIRARQAAVNARLAERLDTLLPRLMREAGIEAWLVIAREYNDDPVYRSLAPAHSFTARRTTMLLFHDRGPEKGVERLTISRYPLGEFYEASWQGGQVAEQWSRLAELLAERSPKNIAINVSRHWPVADGLSHSLHQQLVKSLGPELSGRLVSSEHLVVRWLETRLPSEIAVWRHAVAEARATIAEAFSNRVITPGQTTVGDVAWFIRTRFEQRGLDPWFHPDVNVQHRSEIPEPGVPFFGDDAADRIIERGDILHTDVGLCYQRLCTDTQEMGYVLLPGEQAPPAGLVSALRTGNRWQDLLVAEFATGRTGNDVLSRALATSAQEGIVASVYTHPLGLFGHAPGPTIGMWDNQGPTPVQGDWPLYPMTGYAIEGNVKVPVAEYDGQLVQIKLEQSAWFDGERVEYLAGRQTEWNVIR